MVGFADPPEVAELGPPVYPGQHVVVEHVEGPLQSLGLQLREGGMHMPHPFLDRSIVRQAVDRLVAVDEPAIVVEPLGKLRRDADHVPVVGHFLRHIRIQPDRAAAELVDRHGCRHRGQVHQHVHLVGIPALPQESPSAYQAPCDAPLEQVGDHFHVDSRAPLVPRSGQHVEAGFLLIGQFGRIPVVAKPAVGFVLESFGEVVVDEHRGAGDQHGVEPVDFGCREESAKRRHGPTGFFVEQVPDFRGHC